jgi:tellurium resistance protein TerD
MAISLKKGGDVSLTKNTPKLKKILVGLGWRDADLDVSAFMLGSNGKVNSDEDLIFYGQLNSRCGSIVHNGDNRVGGAGGDDETLSVDLNKVPSTYEKLVICVTFYDAEKTNQNFGLVKDSFMRIVNMENDAEIARFDLTEDYGTETAMIFGEIYRSNQEWNFKAIGQGFNGGLEAMCKRFGVNVA